MTSDGGQTWNDATPTNVTPGSIRGVYFLDSHHGWVVSTSDSNPEQLQISATADGGNSWDTSLLGNPSAFFSDAQGLPAYVDFLDSQHGWVVSMVASSAGVMPRGILLATSDGGTTWQEQSIPVGGPVEFVSSSTGWLADGAQGYNHTAIYVTSDGGQNWTAQTVNPPDGYTQDQATYTIPTFTTPANVVLAAFDNGTNSTAGFYETSNNGSAWQLKAIVPVGKPEGDVSPSTTLIDPTNWISAAPDGTTITNVTQDGSNQQTLSTTGLPSGGTSDASFTANGIGWIIDNTTTCGDSKTNCTQTRALYVTRDGGSTWTQLSVP